MKKIKKPLILLALGATAICGIFIGSNKSAQTPVDVTAESVDDYYKYADTSTRQLLYSSLGTIISANFNSIGYDDLWEAYKTTDLRDNGKIWDMYSNTSYDPDADRDRGDHAYEGHRFNREHSVPKSWFNSQKPAYSDLFHLYPTDGTVNGYRSNYPFGKVANATKTSTNGCKLGDSDTSTGISGTVFEPADEYKGDFARTYFYFATRYNSLAKSMLKEGAGVFSSNFPYLNSKYLDLYYTWHVNDPVSSKEINRNNAVYTLQKNRNPYIDHPEWADYIFKGIEPTPETKTLEKIEVSGTASKKAYYTGDSFDLSGLTVTATFDDNGTKSTSDVTSSVKVEPATLSLDTKSVTLSYTYNKITKSTTYSDYTVSEKPATNYGTLDNPLSVSQAKSLIQEQCTASGAYTKQPIYCRAKVGTISSKDSTNKRMNLYANDISTSSVVMVEGLSMTLEQYNVIATGDEIIFHGYGFKNSYGTYEFFNNSTYYPSLDRNITKEAEIPVSSVTITNSKKDYYIGETCQISTTVLPNNATNKTLTYSSDNTGVASVSSSSGFVTFKAAGNATITAASNNGKTATITFNVTKAPVHVESITASLQPQSTSFYVGDTANTVYNVLPNDADNKDVIFESSNEEVATIDDEGLVSFVKEGLVTIKVVSDDNPSKYAEINVTVSTKPVEDIPVKEIVVDNTLSLELNEETIISYTVNPSNATNKGVSWSSSNSDIVTVDETGKAKGIAEGEATITVTAKDGGGATASIAVKVTKPVDPSTKTIAEIAVVSLPNKTTYQIGEAFDRTGLVVNANFTDGTEADISSKVHLSEVDTTVSGTKSIDVSYLVNEKEYKTSFQVIVLEASVLSINIEKTPAKMNYFADEPLNTYGLVVKATMSDNSVIADVANMCEFEYDFASSNKVQVLFSGACASFFVNLDESEGGKPVQHKAADFAYVFIEKFESKEPASVTQSEWDSLQYYYNKLDSASKEFLKNYKVSSNGNGEVSAEVPEVDVLKQFATKYDAIYKAHKSDGYTDFIGRASVQPVPGPTPTPTPSSDNKALTIAIIVICSVAVVIIAIVIPVEVKRNKNAKKIR